MPQSKYFTPLPISSAMPGVRDGHMEHYKSRPGTRGICQRLNLQCTQAGLDLSVMISIFSIADHRPALRCLATTPRNFSPEETDVAAAPEGRAMIATRTRCDAHVLGVVSSARTLQDTLKNMVCWCWIDLLGVFSQRLGCDITQALEPGEAKVSVGFRK